MVEIEVIDTGTPKAGPYSHALKAGNLIFLSGQVPAQGAMGIKEETLSILNKIKNLLEAAGAGVANIVKTTVYLKHIEDFKEMNEAYKSFFEQNNITDKFPARTTIEATSPVINSSVEIDAIAVI